MDKKRRDQDGIGNDDGIGSHARTERGIALMQESRAHLTADLVTGKLDVRAAATKLPEVADPLEETEMEGTET